MYHYVQHSLWRVHCEKNKIQKKHQGTCGEFITLTPKLQTVAEKFSNVFDSPIIEFKHMYHFGFLFLYLIFHFPFYFKKCKLNIEDLTH